MNYKNKLSVLLCLIGLMIALPAHAQSVIQADKLTYNTPRTHYYTIASGDLSPRDSDKGFREQDGGKYFTDNGSGEFSTGLQLPDDATVTELRAFLYDNSATGDLKITLFARNHGFTASIFHAEVESFGFLDSIRDFAATADNVIRNRTFKYEIKATSGAWPGDSSLRIHSIVVTYTIAEAD